MKTTMLMFAAATVFLAIAGPAFSHHSFSAEFDGTRTINLTGVVTKVEWMNPHTHFYLDVKDPQTARVTNWTCEMGSPNGLIGQGWTRDTLKVGMVVSLEGSRAKDGSNKANARNVLIDGRKLGAASSQGANP